LLYVNLYLQNEGARHVARIGENTYRLLVRKSEGKRKLGRPRCRWVDNIKMDLSDIGLGELDLIRVAQENRVGELL
jgi:hypothetical protein